MLENGMYICFSSSQGQEALEIPVDPQQLDSEIKAIMMVLSACFMVYQCCVLLLLALLLSPWATALPHLSPYSLHPLHPSFLVLPPSLPL